MSLLDESKLAFAKSNTNFQENTGILRGQTSIISGMDGIGKTTFALSEFRNIRNITPIYIDADDKSSNQREVFANYLQSLGGFYLNLHSTDKANTLLEYITYISTKLTDTVNYVIVIDNLSHITGEFENDNSLVTAVRTQLEKVLLKKQNIKVVMLAHSGKSQDGMRGATSFRAAFGEEIQLRKDFELGIIAEVRKDSESLHSTNMYQLILKDKEGFKMEHKALSSTEIIEDKVAYRSKRVEDIVLSLLNHLAKDNTLLVNANKFKQSIFLQATEGVPHTDDINYITSGFIASALKPLYDKLMLFPKITQGMPDKLISLKDISLELFEFNKLKLSKKTIQILEEAKFKGHLVKEDKRKELLQKDIEVLIKEKQTITGEDIRIFIYKDVNVIPVGYSKTFARDNILDTLNKVLEDNETISLVVEGRKRTYKYTNKG